MRSKTASVLDFLSMPHKTTASLYEVLAKEATDAYEKDQVPPNQTIAKQASERGFNRDQIHRVTELANHQINTVLSKSAEDQLFTFPVASVEGVEEYMGRKKAVAEKTASVSEPVAEIDFGAYDMIDQIPDYVDLRTSRRFEQKLASMVKEAEHVEEWSLDTASKQVQANAAAQMQKQASANLEYAEMVLRESLANVRTEWEKVAESEEDQLEFMYAGAAVLGIPGVQQVASSFGEQAEKIAEGLDSAYLELISKHIDSQHPVVEGFESFKEKVSSYGEAKEASVLSATKNKALQVVDRAQNSRFARALRRPVPKVLAATTTAAALAPQVGMDRTEAAKTVGEAVLFPSLKENKKRMNIMKSSIREMS